MHIYLTFSSRCCNTLLPEQGRRWLPLTYSYGCQDLRPNGHAFMDSLRSEFLSLALGPVRVCCRIGGTHLSSGSSYSYIILVCREGRTSSSRDVAIPLSTQAQSECLSSTLQQGAIYMRVMVTSTAMTRDIGYRSFSSAVSSRHVVLPDFPRC